MCWIIKVTLLCEVCFLMYWFLSLQTIMGKIIRIALLYCRNIILSKHQWKAIASSQLFQWFQVAWFVSSGCSWISYSNSDWLVWTSNPLLNQGCNWRKLQAKQINSKDWRCGFFKKNLYVKPKEGDNRCWIDKKYAN